MSGDFSYKTNLNPDHNSFKFSRYRYINSENDEENEGDNNGFDINNFQISQIFENLNNIHLNEDKKLTLASLEFLEFFTHNEDLKIYLTDHSLFEQIFKIVTNFIISNKVEPIYHQYGLKIINNMMESSENIAVEVIEQYFQICTEFLKNYLPNLNENQSILLECLSLLLTLAKIYRGNPKDFYNQIKSFLILIFNANPKIPILINSSFNILSQLYKNDFNIYELFLADGLLALCFDYMTSHFCFESASHFLGLISVSSQKAFNLFPSNYKDLFFAFLNDQNDSIIISTIKLISKLSLNQYFPDSILTDRRILPMLLSYNERSLEVKKQAIELFTTYMGDATIYPRISYIFDEYEDLDFFCDYLELQNLPVSQCIVDCLMRISDIKDHNAPLPEIFMKLLNSHSLMEKLRELSEDESYPTLNEAVWYVLSNCEAEIERYGLAQNQNQNQNDEDD
ncbi:hypothetical protein TRFO_11176 [Tritrichomonas foetus]|uniref:Uncharacterized protein n=1 Tax=Tritrichomonas foetus TaxID=1144522 RepID=A0A1J4J6P3_9EUKA|nr:hypothetical protein TRFO_11176 [Tritrichomonas foetus]|eukprot:OHS94321.1 hypothetical protein TRFO_11176 [Tritrichomonas foetus]